jgi:GNAT superfamily N-acetyltransferase
MDDARLGEGAHPPAAIVRSMREADYESVLDLLSELNIHERQIFPERLTDRAAAIAYLRHLRARLDETEGVVLLAEIRGTVVGMMGYSVETDDPLVAPEWRRYGFVTDLVVTARQRRAGAGTMLLQEAERITRQKGLKRLMIGVLNGNAEAERAYVRFGFQAIATEFVKRLE